MTDDHDDKRFFREQMSGVRRLSTDQAPLTRPKPDPRARFARDDRKQVLHDSLNGDPDTDGHREVAFSRPGVRPSVMRKLRRGKYSITGELDLHGMNLGDAEAAMDEFIAECRRLDRRCVRIIHGKGTRSGSDGPVLKPNVYRWLRRRDTVLAYTTARQADGGSGALYVLLR